MKALFAFACLVLPACSSTSRYVCSVAGADVYEFRGPARVGRIRIDGIVIDGTTDQGVKVEVRCGETGRLEK